MASIIESCIRAAIDAGTLSEKGAGEYRERMKQREQEALERGLGGPEAHAFAVTEAARELEQRATSQRAAVQRTILAVDRAWEGAGKNSRGRGYGLTDVLGEHVAAEGSGHSLGQQRFANTAMFQGIMGEYFARMQSRLAGLKQNAILPAHVLGELFGRDTGDAAAKEAAKAWTKALETWRDEMNRHGVFVRSMDDYRLPQHWSAERVRMAGPDGFAQQMGEWWDGGQLRLRDWRKEGDVALDPAKPEDRKRAAEIFQKAFENITTSGDANLEPGAFHAVNMAQRYGRRRVFEWSSDEAWKAFNRTYGVGDSAIGELMIRHVDKMSRDLALAQVLGPDPDRAAGYLVAMYRKETAGKTFRQASWANTLQAMYEIQSGKAQVPVSQRLALAGQAMRQGLTAVQLGSTLLGSAADFGFTRATARWLDLDMTRIMGDYLSNLKPQSVEDRAEAMRRGLITEVGLRGLHDVARDTLGDIQAGYRAGEGHWIDAGLNGLARATGRTAEFVMRAQGLLHHTQQLRDAIGADILRAIGERAPRSWDELSGVEKRLFTEYGMDGKDWDILRTKGVDATGIADPARLAREGEGAERDAALKMLGAIALIQRTAVPEGNVVTRAMMVGSTRPGSLAGEALRSFAQYKGFTSAAFMSSFFRATDRLADGEGKWNRAQWVASLVIGTTMLGILSNQLKNIANGKDPEPLYGDDWKQTAGIIARGFAQGGAGGILGSEMQSIFQSRRLDDASRLATPAGALGIDTLQLMLGWAHGAANPNKSGETRETEGMNAARFVHKYTPSLWYTRLAQDRILHDTLTRLADPDAAQTFQRMQEAARKQGTAYWWRPGSGMNGPQRGPDLSRAVP